MATSSPRKTVSGFFLSSIDDPCPLSALEALNAGVGCVAYEQTGTAELIQGFLGCSIYRDYNPEAALFAIEEALQSDSQHTKQNRTSLVNIATLSNFTEKIDRALDLH